MKGTRGSLDIVGYGALALGLMTLAGCGNGPIDDPARRDAPTTTLGGTTGYVPSSTSTSLGTSSTGDEIGSSGCPVCEATDTGCVVPQEPIECEACPSPPPECEGGSTGGTDGCDGDSSSSEGGSTSTGEPPSGSSGPWTSTSTGEPPSGSSGPWTSTTGYVSLPQDQPRSLQAPIHTQASKKTADCPGTTTLPANCTPVNGTSDDDARWLWCHREAGGGLGGFIVCTCADALVGNGVNQAIIDQIENNCQNESTPQAVLECVGELCDAAVGGTKEENEGVCRHHAACVDDVLDEMGISHSFDESPTHLWNEAPVDTDGDGVNDGTLIIDSYNDVYILCDDT